MPAAANINDNLRGIAFMFLAMFALSCLDASAKALIADYSVWQIIFLRNLFALVPVLIFVWRAGGFANLRTHRLPQHFARAMLGMAMMALFFTSLATLKLADAIAIAFVAPLITTALSGPLLGDSVGRHRWSAIFIGLIGVLVMVRPGTGAFQPAAMLVLGGIFFYSLAMLWSRRLSRTESSAAIACYYTFSTILMSGIILAFTGWRTPTPEAWGLFLIAGVGGGIGMFCLAEAYRFGEPASVAPMEYSTMIWALLLGWLFWQELPDGPVYAGAVLVIGAGLYVIHRERVRGRTPLPATPPLTVPVDTPLPSRSKGARR